MVTKAIEPLAMKDLPKFIGAMSSLAKADASLSVSTNSETGEALLAGMGELHLEITIYRLEEEHGIKVKQSDPIVVYRECIQSQNDGSPFEGSPQPPQQVLRRDRATATRGHPGHEEGEFGDGTVRNKDAKEVGDKFAAYGLNKDLMRKIYAISGTNVLVNDTKGIQNLHETRELIIEGFNEVCKKGPLQRSPHGRHGQADRRQASRGRHPPWPCPDHTRGQERHRGSLVRSRPSFSSRSRTSGSTRPTTSSVA